MEKDRGVPVDRFKIRRLRKELGLSQKAFVTGVCSQELLSAIERGRAKPTPDVLSGIAAKLGVKVDELRDKNAPLPEVIKAKPDARFDGTKLRKFRKERGWTQGQLAKGICSRQFICEVELCRKQPSIEIIRGLAIKLKVKMEDFR